MSESDPTPVNPEFASIMATMARYDSRLAVSNAKTKASLFAALAAAGVAKVTVVFDGQGDSGAVEDVLASAAGDVAVDLPDVSIDYFAAGFSDDEEEVVTQRPLKEAIESLAFAFLSQTHGGWENNEGGFGDFFFDVAAGSVRLDYQERYTETTSYEHDF